MHLCSIIYEILLDGELHSVLISSSCEKRVRLYTTRNLSHSSNEVGMVDNKNITFELIAVATGS